MNLAKLLKTSAVFWLSSSTMANDNGFKALQRETMEEINDKYYPDEMKQILQKQEREVNLKKAVVYQSGSLAMFDISYLSEACEHLHQHEVLKANYYKLVQEFDEKLRAERKFFLDKGKELMLGLDGLFKEAGQNHVKYHQVAASVYLALYDAFAQNDKKALTMIFGNKVKNVHAMQTYRSLIIDIVTDIKNAKTDVEINKVLNNYLFVDQEGRFPKKIEHYAEPSLFSGTIVIRPAFNQKVFLKNGDIVNVVLTINLKDLPAVIEPIRESLLTFGVKEGRLTGTNDSEERHVSLALRIPYSLELKNIVETLNRRIKIHTFKTSGNLVVVTPMDIRTGCSVLSEISPESEKLFKELQRELYATLENTGNNLPPMHITQGNAKIRPAGEEEMINLHKVFPTLEEHLSNYNLALEEAIHGVYGDELLVQRLTCH